jgi:2'-5' RNA ligase
MPAVRPLIVTLGLDPAAQSLFEEQRRRYFPARLNRIPAHISLFHALPGEQRSLIAERLAEHAGATASFSAEVHDLMRLGRGVAYALRAEALDRLHAALRREWLEWLTPQDRQPFRPHIVVQNKVDPKEAQALYAKLSGSFRPFEVQAVSLLLWRYEGGPWTPAGEFPLAGARA